MTTRDVDLYLVGVSALFLSFLGFWDGRYIPALVLLVVAISSLLLPSLLSSRRQRGAERSSSRLGSSIDIYWVMRIVGGMLILAPGSYALQHGEHALAILMFVIGAGTTYLGWHLHQRRG